MNSLRSILLWMLIGCITCCMTKSASADSSSGHSRPPDSIARMRTDLQLAQNPAAPAAPADAETADPATTTDSLIDKRVGSQKCIECHDHAGEAWKHTHHFNTYNELHSRPKAAEIAKNMNIRRIKRADTCTQCHYTVMTVDDKPKSVSGISCESCHGAARDWIDIHNDFGGPGVQRNQETEDHRKLRLEKTEKAGMIRPDQLYRLAENCYQCHTVPNEQLVNVGGHKAGSNFELVRWLSGEVRHNFSISDSARENKDASIERKRMLYVIGQILDMEYGFRGVAKATKKDAYAVSMAKRAIRARKRLQKIQNLVNPAPDGNAVPELIEILKLAQQKLKLNNETALTSAADEISVLAQKFVAEHDGSELAAIDSLLPGPDKYRGTVYTVDQP